MSEAQLHLVVAKMIHDYNLLLLLDMRSIVSLMKLFIKKSEILIQQNLHKIFKLDQISEDMSK